MRWQWRVEMPIWRELAPRVNSDNSHTRELHRQCCTETSQTTFYTPQRWGCSCRQSIELNRTSCNNSLKRGPGIRCTPYRFGEELQWPRPRKDRNKIPEFLAACILLLTLHNVLRSLMEPPAPAFRNDSCLHDSFPKSPHYGISRLILSDENLITRSAHSSYP